MQNVANLPQAQNIVTFQTETLNLNPNIIVLPRWGNPRSSRDPKKFSELVNSVKQKGVYQPILVRFINDTYEMIAGYGRLDAAKLNNLESIPCRVFYNLSDKDSIELGVSENMDREQMSILDEAKGIRNIVAQNNGDIDAAMDAMGWNKRKFQLALQLLKSSDKVQSLIGVKNDNGFVLTVGHAAVLSSLPEQGQDKIVDTVIAESMTIDALKKALSNAVERPLESACFDISVDCLTCKYNKAQQVSFFEEDNQSSSCMNPKCFERKTDEFIQSRKQELETEYGRVILLSTVEGSVVTVDKNIVGDDQFVSGCLSCEKYAAVMVDKGKNIGRIATNQCLDISCAQKCSSKNKAKSKAKATVVAPSKNDADSSNDSKVQTNPEKAKENIVSVGNVPKRLSISAQKQIRKIGGTELIGSSPVFSLAVLTAIAKSKVSLGTDIEKEILSYMSLTEQELEAKILEIISKLTYETQNESFNVERTVIFAANQNLENFTAKVIAEWIPTKANLTDMTKAIRIQCLEESGFSKAYNKKIGAGEFEKLCKMKSDDQIKEILEFDFDWSNYAPKYYLDTLTKPIYNN